MDERLPTKRSAKIEFENAFDIPVEVARAWPVLADIQNVAACLPGVELSKALDSTTYKGQFSVPLGPVTLTISGVVEVEELDPVNHRARISARGSQPEDEGAVSGTATFEIHPEGEGSRVVVHTEIRLSGMAARLGGNVGAVQDMADRILARFASNLSARLMEDAGGPDFKAGT